MSFFVVTLALFVYLQSSEIPNWFLMGVDYLENCNYAEKQIWVYQNVLSFSKENAFRSVLVNVQSGKRERWGSSEGFFGVAYGAKGSALCCTISQCLSALSQNNWCQAYMVYMPVLGHGCQGGRQDSRGGTSRPVSPSVCRLMCFLTAI